MFHDLGNLNFTFLAGEKDYDVARQLKVIVGAVRAFGLNAQVSGRNDIAIDGRKFSGNAFYKTRGKCYHHGTLLINADIQAMGKYLSVSNEKLSSKGVKSVGARVVNLHALCEDITVLNMQRALLKAFGQVYELTPAPLCEHTLDAQILQQKQEKFSSWQWNFGSKIPFTAERHKRFAWGDLQLQLSVNEGVIQALRVYSDAMDQDIFLALEKALANCPLKRTALLERLAYIPNQTM